MIKSNPYNFGSINYLIFESSKIKDIKYITTDKDEYGFTYLKIIVKPNYDIDMIQKFIYDHVPINIQTAVIVEENNEIIQ